MNGAGSGHDGAGPPTWRTYTGKRVTVHAPEGSYAARRAAGELRDAERAADALQRLIDPPGGGKAGRVEVYLVDPAAPDAPAAGPAAAAAALVRVVRPEGSGESIAVPVVQALLAQWFGPGVAGAGLFLRGIAGIAAARTGAEASVKEADAWVKSEVSAGRPVTVFGVGGSGPNAPGPRESGLIATSFVAHLVETFGVAPLRHYLAAYDPARSDQASLAAYSRTVGTLEEGWLTEMRRRGGGSTAYRAFFRQIVPLIKPYWRTQLEVFAYLIFALAYGLAMPLASKFLIDTIIPSGKVDNLFIFIGVLFALYALDSVISMRRAYVNSWMNQMILRGLQQRMFAHLQRLAHNFYGRAKIGDVLTRLTSDLQMVQGAMAAVINTGIFSTVSAVAAGVAMMLLSPVLGLLVLVVLPLFIFAYLGLRTRLQTASYARQKIAGELTSLVQENLSAHAVVKALGLEARAVAAFESRLMAIFRAGLRLVTISSLFGASTDLAMTLGQVLVLGAGGYLAMQGHLTVGTLLAFFAYLPAVFGPVGALAGLGQTVQTALGSMERVNDLIEEPLAIADQPAAVALPPLSSAIRLENVSFSYGGDRPIIAGLNLTIPAGANVAIVGPSGSGKSTIVNLLMRFWDPEEGRVLFDGHDLRDVTAASLRGQTGLVFQDTFVFDTSLRENIGLSKPGSPDAAIEAAARAARLDSYIDSLPAGFSTVLGERGSRMSGGQRQRLAIARALLRDPRLLILDEATSALDAQTEREILDTFSEVAQGRTTVSITHRLSYAAKSDIIYVLEAGRLVEQGSHVDLIAAGGLYSRLYAEQTGYATGAGSRVGVEEARLRSIPLFAGLGAQPLAAIADRLGIERLAAGEEVARQGDPGDKMYIISRGQAEVLRDERRVNTLNEGDYFGEMALLADEARTATVRTTMPTELYSLSHWDFTALLDREPTVRQAVQETVALRRAALAEVHDISLKIPS